jgi:hypothetical protein
VSPTVASIGFGEYAPDPSDDAPGTMLAFMVAAKTEGNCAGKMAKSNREQVAKVRRTFMRPKD